MVLSLEESKARRLAGVKKANMQMTAAQKVHRALVNGRPPASEFRTPLAAVAAARILHRDIEARMTADGLKPKPSDWGVSVGYVTPDLTTLGATVLYGPRHEEALMLHLTGNVMLGTIFAIVDLEDEGSVVLGAKPFITTKQTEGWLEELHHPVRCSLEDEQR